MTRVLEVKNVRNKSFGGVQAVRGVSFGVEEGEILGIIGPNGSRQIHSVQLHPRPAHSLGRRSAARRPRRHGTAPFGEVSRRGVGRTFQLLQVFPQLSLRENLILAGQEHKGTRLGRLFGPRGCRALGGRRSDDRLLPSSVISPARPPAACPTASRSCSTPRWPSWAGRAWCCWTSRPAASTSTMLGRSQGAAGSDQPREARDLRGDRTQHGIRDVAVLAGHGDGGRQGAGDGPTRRSARRSRR